MAACLGLMLAALPALSAPAADDPEVSRPVFDLLPSPNQLAMVQKYAGNLMARAEKAHFPAQPQVAMAGSTTLISLESVAICDRASGCPLLVFRDMTKPPVLVTSSYQNVMIVYRADKTVLILKSSGPDRECLLPLFGKAKCKPVARPK